MRSLVQQTVRSRRQANSVPDNLVPAVCNWCQSKELFLPRRMLLLALFNLQHTRPHYVDGHIEPNDELADKIQQ